MHGWSDLQPHARPCVIASRAITAPRIPLAGHGRAAGLKDATLTDDAKPRTIAQLPWIKARVGLERDPVVLFMAEKLKRHRKYVVGCWLALWAWSDSVTEDGWLPGMTPAGIDSVVEHKGFCAAALAFPEHAWIESADGGLILPRYDRHNGVSAKGRALDSERKRKARMAEECPPPVRSLSGSDADETGTRGEERREEEITTAHPSAEGVVVGATIGNGHRPTRKPWSPKNERTVPMAEYLGRAVAHFKPDALALGTVSASVASLRGIETLLTKRKPEEVEAVIDWLFGAEPGDYEPTAKFDWRPNIASGASLLHSFDRLESEYRFATEPDRR